MKRRVLSLLLVAAMFLALAPAAFAAGAVTKVEIWVENPVAGEGPRSPEVTVLGRSDGAAFTLSDKKDYTLIYRWHESGKQAEFSGTFVNGRGYDLTVTLKGILDGFTVDETTEIYLDGDKKDLSVLSKTNSDVIFTLSFAAISGDITPAVSVAADGKAEKEYDGQNVTLRANITNMMNGVTYTYQWFRDGAAVSGGTNETLAVKNVADSGSYTCKVTAASAGEKKSTDSLGVKVKITPHPVTLVLEDVEKNDGDPDPELVYTVIGDVYDTLTGAPVREEGEAVGSYEISVGTLAFAEDAAGNYTVTTRTGRFTIAGTGTVTFAALSDVADLSYIVGKSSSHIRVSATKSALPKGAVLTLSTVDEKALEDLNTAAGKTAIMKSLTVSVTDGSNANAELNKNAVLRLMIPLTEKEEKFDPKTLKALFRKPSGFVEPLEMRREKDDQTGVVYLIVELRSPGSVALLEGKVTTKKKDTKETEDTAPEPRKKGTWLWVLVGLFAAAAAGITIWAWIRSKKSDAPTKTYTPQEKRTNAPPMPRRLRMPPPERQNTGDRQTKPAPPAAGRVVSFEELEEEEEEENR